MTPSNNERKGVTPIKEKGAHLFIFNIVEPECEWVIARDIEQNPVRAGLVQKVKEYHDSSAGAHIKGESDGILGEDNIGNERAAYCEFMRENNKNKKV